MGLLRCAKPGQARSLILGWSDRQDQLVEGSRHPWRRVFFDSEFVVTAAEVLDERVSGADHPRAVETFETAHWP